MSVLMKKIRSVLCDFRKDEDGGPLVEFIVVMPVVLLVMIPGSYEATNALLVKRKNDQIATILADLATQSASINGTEWMNLSRIVGRVMEPYDDLDVRMRLVGVQIDGNKKINTVWSYGTASLDTTSLPSSLVQPNSFYVMSAAEVDYKSVFKVEGIGNMTFRDTAVMTPRLTSTVENK